MSDDNKTVEALANGSKSVVVFFDPEKKKKNLEYVLDAEDKYDGLMSRYDLNGVLQETRTFRHGKLNGPSTRFHPDGETPSLISEYSDGVKTQDRSYYITGELKAEVGVIKGKYEGEMNVYEKDGSIKNIIEYQNGIAIADHPVQKHDAADMAAVAINAATDQQPEEAAATEEKKGKEDKVESSSEEVFKMEKAETNTDTLDKILSSSSIWQTLTNEFAQRVEALSGITQFTGDVYKTAFNMMAEDHGKEEFTLGFHLDGDKLMPNVQSDGYLAPEATRVLNLPVNYNVKYSTSEDYQQYQNDLDCLKLLTEEYCRNTRQKPVLHTSEESMSNAERQMLLEHPTTKGWYDDKKAEVHLFLPNCTDMDDVQRTIIHETAGHRGLQALLKDRYGDFLNQAYDVLNEGERKEVISLQAYKGMTRQQAMDEYLAQRIETFNPADREQRSFFQRIADALKNVLHKMGFRYKMSAYDLTNAMFLSKSYAEGHMSKVSYMLKANTFRSKFDNVECDTNDLSFRLRDPGYSGKKFSGSKSYNADGQSAEDKALDRFAELLIEKIETIKADWKKPWFTEGTMQWPKNLDGREYNGMNAFMLMLEAEKHDYEIPVFMTYDRVARLNDQKKKDEAEKPYVTVSRGEKSFPVFLTTFTVVDKDTKEKIKYDDYKKLSSEEQAKYTVYPKQHVYNVFNVDQTNIKEARPELYAKLQEQNAKKTSLVLNGEAFSFPAIDRLIEQNEWICPIKREHQDHACYTPSTNSITVPEKKQFDTGEHFYSTLVHEMAHSTGYKDVLDRLKPAPFGSPEYGREELVAETTAALTMQRYGIQTGIQEDNVAYLQSWLGAIKEDPDFIKTVLTDVKKASGIINAHIDEQQQKIDNGLTEGNGVDNGVTDEQPKAVLEDEQEEEHHRGYGR